jgi:hypothetical protein
MSDTASTWKKMGNMVSCPRPTHIVCTTDANGKTKYKRTFVKPCHPMITRSKAKSKTRKVDHIKCDLVDGKWKYTRSKVEVQENQIYHPMFTRSKIDALFMDHGLNDMRYGEQKKVDHMVITRTSCCRWNVQNDNDILSSTTIVTTCGYNADV